MTAVRDRRLGRTQGQTRFWWIRHAVVPAASGGRISGQADLDCDLSDEAAVAWLRSRLPDGEFVFVASPLKRAMDTGRAVTRREPDETDPRLMEQDFGAWTQQAWKDLNEEAEEIGFWADPVTCAPPEGESFAALCERVGAWMTEAAARYAGQDVVVACHGGVVRGAIAHGLGLEPADSGPVLRMVIDNLSLTRIDALEGGSAVVSVNELPKRKA